MSLHGFHQHASVHSDKSVNLLYTVCTLLFLVQILESNKLRSLHKRLHLVNSILLSDKGVT
jgi:hypothetical protein